MPQVADEDHGRQQRQHLEVDARPLGGAGPFGRDIFSYLVATGLMNKTRDSRLGRRLRDRETLIGSSPRAARRNGFGLDHAWIDAPIFNADGAVEHDPGVTRSNGLYFLGLPWQHTRGSALLGWVKDDAAHLATHMSNRTQGTHA